MHDRSEEEGSDSSVNGTEPQVHDVVKNSRRTSPALTAAPQ